MNRVNTTEPFAQFQNCDDKEESLAKLVIQLLGRIPGSEPDRDAILMQAKTFKEAAAKALSKTGDTGESESTPEISVAKLFEEIKLMFQDLPGRIEERVARGPVRQRRSVRMHSMVMHDMMHTIVERGDDPLAILILASMLREDIPWVYELGREAYEAVRTGNPSQRPGNGSIPCPARRSAQSFSRGIRSSSRNAHGAGALYRIDPS